MAITGNDTVLLQIEKKIDHWVNGGIQGFGIPMVMRLEFARPDDTGRFQIFSCGHDVRSFDPDKGIGGFLLICLCFSRS